MGSGEKKQLQLPVIDFRGLDPEKPTTEQWGVARRAVVEALEAYGCFQAIYDQPGPEAQEEMFERAMPELFALHRPNIAQTPGSAYQYLAVPGAATLEQAQRFTSLMWPQGNPSFCMIAWTYAKHMRGLAQMAQRMVLQDLGLEKYSNLHNESEASGLYLSEYGAASLAEETTISLRSHKDSGMFTVFSHHQVEGLEVQTKNGEWIRVVPLPNAFTLIIGEAFTAWTNGRFQAPLHCVKLIGEAKSYSVLYATQPSDDSMVHPLEELADSNHPLLFKPFTYKEYLAFRLSDEGRKYSDTLEAFCGAGSEGKTCEL